MIADKAKSFISATWDLFPIIFTIGMMLWLGGMGFLLGYMTGQGDVYVDCAQTARWDSGGRGMYCRVDE